MSHFMVDFESVMVQLDTYPAEHFKVQFKESFHAKGSNLLELRARTDPELLSLILLSEKVC